MAFNGAGVYSLYQPGNPVVTGTTISSSWANNTLNDIATALSTCVLKDGTQTITANIPMSTFKITGLGNGTLTQDAMAYGQRMKTVVFSTTHDVSVTGTQDVTTTGITPVCVVIFAGVSATLKSSYGVDDGTTRCVVGNSSYSAGGQVTTSTGFCIYLIEGGGVYTTATVSALASGKFTLTWAKSGSPTGTAAVLGIAFGY